MLEMIVSAHREFAITVVIVALFLPVRLSAQQSQTQHDKTTTLHDETEIPLQPQESPEPSGPAVSEVKIPNYAACPLAELQHAVPELSHLKPAADQSQLTGLLDKIGAKMQDIVGKTPNLISDELVLTDQTGVNTRQNYSFLVVRHEGLNGIVFDEYRVDPATGKKFETDAIAAAAGIKPGSAPSELPTVRASDLNSYGAPASQGFAGEWLHFYSSNRGLANFRFLGEQEMDRHHTLVVAFAQKPAMVRVPATISYGERTFNLYRQGVAWVDASDYRIVRLRSDILSAPQGVPLRQLTADIQFTQVIIAQLADPLWLPHQVVVTANLAGSMTRETHVYSKHRLFHAQSKILLNP